MSYYMCREGRTPRATPEPTMSPTQQAAAAAEAANNMLDMAGQATDGLPNARAWVTTHECCGQLRGQTYQVVRLAILGHRPGDRMGRSVRDRAIVAAIMAAAAEVDGHFQVDTLP